MKKLLFLSSATIFACTLFTPNCLNAARSKTISAAELVLSRASTRTSARTGTRIMMPGIPRSPALSFGLGQKSSLAAWPLMNPLPSRQPQPRARSPFAWQQPRLLTGQASNPELNPELNPDNKPESESPTLAPALSVPIDPDNLPESEKTKEELASLEEQTSFFLQEVLNVISREQLDTILELITKNEQLKKAYSEINCPDLKKAINTGRTILEKTTLKLVEDQLSLLTKMVNIMIASEKQSTIRQLLDYKNINAGIKKEEDRLEEIRNILEKLMIINSFLNPTEDQNQNEIDKTMPSIKQCTIKAWMVNLKKEVAELLFTKETFVDLKKDLEEYSKRVGA